MENSEQQKLPVTDDKKQMMTPGRYHSDQTAGQLYSRQSDAKKEDFVFIEPDPRKQFITDILY